MNMLVWAMMGIAIWHFAVFVPDHFWGGIVGAFGAAALGAVIVGFALAGGELENTRLLTALEAVPGALLGLAASYFWGLRVEREHQHA
jgi:hypothetical protein